MQKHPLGEIFGFRPGDHSSQAERYRKLKLCPFNNKVPNCTKDKAELPLGVCSVIHQGRPAITCPVRFREDWLIAEDAAAFFFDPNATWTSLTEVTLNDADGKSAGNIDVVLVAYDEQGAITDFGALEVQAVYISGNVRRPFEAYMQNPEGNSDMDWRKAANYPRPDFLSSSRKRLAPQLLFKGGILNSWKRKMAVALDEPFFRTLPTLTEVAKEDAEVAWLVYDLVSDENSERFGLTRTRVIYTNFEDSLHAITKPRVGPESEFLKVLQGKLDEKRLVVNPPDNSTIELPPL